MLRRAGEVFKEVGESARARGAHRRRRICRPVAGDRRKRRRRDRRSIRKVVELNNQFYTGTPLSFAVGVATGRAGERLEEVVKRADALMYRAKRAYYAEPVACAKANSQTSQIVGATRPRSRRRCSEAAGRHRASQPIPSSTRVRAVDHADKRRRRLPKVRSRSSKLSSGFRIAAFSGALGPSAAISGARPGPNLAPLATASV